MVPLLDYFLSAGQLANPPLDGPLYRAAAQATVEALTAWGHDRAENVRLRGNAFGCSGSGRIVQQTSYLAVYENPGLVRAVCAETQASPLATSLAVSLSAGLCRALSSRGRYRGTCPGVGQGFDESIVEVADPRALDQALAERFAASGLGGSATCALLPSLGAILALTLQQAVGRAAVVGQRGPGSGRCSPVCALLLE